MDQKAEIEKLVPLFNAAAARVKLTPGLATKEAAILLPLVHAAARRVTNGASNLQPDKTKGN